MKILSTVLLFLLFFSCSQEDQEFGPAENPETVSYTVIPDPETEERKCDCHITIENISQISLGSNLLQRTKLFSLTTPTCNEQCYFGALSPIDFPITCNNVGPTGCDYYNWVETIDEMGMPFTCPVEPRD